VLLVRLVDLAVEHRRIVGMLQRDPVMVRLLGQHAPFRRLMERLQGLLAADIGVDGRVSTAMLAAAISGAATHPLVAEVDDETLRADLLDLARRFLDLNGR
jgi:hypothetical protein